MQADQIIIFECWRITQISLNIRKIDMRGECPRQRCPHRGTAGLRYVNINDFRSALAQGCRMKKAHERPTESDGRGAPNIAFDFFRTAENYEDFVREDPLPL